MTDRPANPGNEPETGESLPASSDIGTYQVGYGKPPKHGQIKPGEIRNRRGKLRGTRSLKTEIREMLAMPVPLREEKRIRMITTRQASLMKLREKALKGDSRSLDRLLEYAAQFDEADGVVATTASLSAEDEQILANARARDLQAALANNPAVAAPDAVPAANEPEESR